MKTTLIALLFLCATAAFGQAGVLVTNEPQPIQMSSHMQRATQQSMQTEQSLLITSSGNTSAHGERPLWEVGAKPPVEIPLGDVARLLRTQHATVRRAVMSLDK